MVAAPWRRFIHAARWNGQRAPQRRPGVARVNVSHCQLSNCSVLIIDISSTGSDRTRGDDEPVAQRRGLGSSSAGGSLGRRRPVGAASAW